MSMRRTVLMMAVAAAAGGAMVSASGGAMIEAVDAFRLAYRESGLGSGADVRSASDFDSVFVLNASRNPVVGAIADPATGNGLVAVGNPSGVANVTGIKALMGVSTSNSGRLVVWNGANSATFVVDGNTGLQSGPADLAEAFSATTPDVLPGTVMVIDPAQPGRMSVSSQAYDHRVAGVVAGANDYPSAITLGGLTEKENKVALTLSGTVYVRASAENGRIRAGDLLTTAKTPGHAMKVTDHDQARGAILGKAMQDLDAETGSILVLASLQ
jgi:hypothetical protein